MAKKQTRRGVSMSAAMIEAVREAAALVGENVSQFVHVAVAQRMSALDIVAPQYIAPGTNSAESARKAREERLAAMDQHSRSLIRQRSDERAAARKAPEGAK